MELGSLDSSQKVTLIREKVSQIYIYSSLFEKIFKVSSKHGQGNCAALCPGKAIDLARREWRPGRVRACRSQRPAAAPPAAPRVRYAAPAARRRRRSVPIPRGESTRPRPVAVATRENRAAPGARRARRGWLCGAGAPRSRGLGVRVAVSPCKVCRCLAFQKKKIYRC